MKTYFKSSELPHIWAQLTADEIKSDRSGRCAAHESFRGADYFSYSAVIGRLVRGKDGSRGAIVSRKRYSPTTSGHQAGVRQAASHLNPFLVTTWANVTPREVLEDFRGRTLESLADYITTHVKRGACQCGRCADAGPNPAANQPSGHTVDLTFFKVCAVADPSADELRKLIAAHKGEYVECNPLDGQEHGYIELGAWLGDQGLALMFIGLCDLVGLGRALSPNTVMPFLPEDTRQSLAAGGYVTFQTQLTPK